MKVDILVDKKRELKMEVIGESHTFFNMLKGELFEISDVKNCGYRQEHPLIDKTIFFMFTKKASKKVLKKALKNIDKKLKSFKRAVK